MAIKIALAGNPNCGKTTMCNALTGANQYVGNWPGVTVEKKEGKCKENKDVIVTDLPGIYSLSPYTLEEVVSRDYLLKEKPEAIINLVDATNIERNLYLTTQLLELGIPVVIALNMADLLEKNKISIDTKHCFRRNKVFKGYRSGCFRDGRTVAVIRFRRTEKMVCDQAAGARCESTGAVKTDCICTESSRKNRCQTGRKAG